MVKADYLWHNPLIVTSVLYLVSQASPEGFSRLGGMTGNTTWATAWFLLSVAVNIFVTTSISYNLISEQRRLARALSKHRVRVYTDIVAILLESALPFSVLGIAAGVVKAVGYDVSALNEAWFAFCVREFLHFASGFNSSCSINQISPPLFNRHSHRNSSYSVS